MINKIAMKIGIYILIIFLSSTSIWAQSCEEIYNGEWMESSICEKEFSIKTPVELEYSIKEIATTLKDKIKKISLYSYEENPSLKIKIQCITYAEGYEGDLNELEKSTEGEIILMGGEEITVKSKPANRSDVEGIKQEGWMTIDERMYDFMSTIYARNNTVWNIFVMHEQHDMYGYVVADKIIQSVSFSKSESN